MFGIDEKFADIVRKGVTTPNDIHDFFSLLNVPLVYVVEDWVHLRVHVFIKCGFGEASYYKELLTRFTPIHTRIFVYRYNWLWKINFMIDNFFDRRGWFKSTKCIKHLYKD